MTVMRDTSRQDRPLARRRSPLVYGLLLLAVAVVALGAMAVPSLLRWSSVEQSIAAERLRFAMVERGPFIRDVSVQGRIVAAVSPTLYAKAPGTVDLAVQAGDTVTRGQVLATVDSPELASRLEQERATLVGRDTELQRLRIDARQQQLAQQKTVDDARVVLTAAEREHRRAETAFERSAISELDYEKARDELERARLDHRHAVAEAELLTDALAFEIETQVAAVERQRLTARDLERQVTELAVRSPVDGMVGNLAVNHYAFAAANAPLLTVIDLSALQVEVAIPEAYAESLAIGMEADVRWGRDVYPGLLAAISPEVSNNQVTGRIRFRDAPPEGIRQNQRVSARVVLEHKEDTLFVRRGPFFDAGAGRIAYVVGDGVAERRRIVPGSVSVDRIEILEGLDQGERIVLSSTTLFQDAERVLLNP